MSRLGLACLLLVGAFSASVALAAKPDPPSRLTFGEVGDGCVYAASSGPYPDDPDDSYHQVMLSRVRLDGKRLAPTAGNFQFPLLIGLSPRAGPYHWRISAGRLWGGTSRIDNFIVGTFFTRLALSSLGSFKPVDKPEVKAVLGDFRKLEGGLLDSDQLWNLLPDDEKVIRAIKAQFGPEGTGGFCAGGYRGEYPVGIYHDLLPLDDTHGRIFVLDHGRLSVYDGTGTQEEKGRSWKLEWTEREQDRCQAGFSEPFVVRGSADAGYTFVTESGNVFFSPPPVGKAKRRIHAVYSDAYQPVRVLITDNATGKTFAFTRPAYPKDADGEKNAVFFEVGPDPEPKPYQLPKTEVKFMPAAVKDVPAYAAFLLDAGLITPNPAK